MPQTNKQRPRWIATITITAILFGLLTIFSGASILFLDGSARAAAGEYVPFVLWFNFLAGFLYIVAAIGLSAGRGWAIKLSMFIAMATITVFVTLLIAIATGTPFEFRTIAAMTLRSVFWTFIAAFSTLSWKARFSS